MSDVRDAAEAPRDRPRAMREHLPDERESITLHAELGMPDGVLDAYLIIGKYPDGRPGEVFLKIEGVDADRYAGLADAFAIALSIALQHGVPLQAFTAKLRGSRAQPTGRSGQRLSASLIDVIARRLDEKFPGVG